MTSPPEPQEPARTWVGEWIRSEAFWRDVASRTLAGLIVAAFIGAAAAASGFIPWLTLLKVVALFVALGVGMFGGLWLGLYLVRNKDLESDWVSVVVAVPALAGLGLAVLACTWIVQW